MSITTRDAFEGRPFPQYSGMVGLREIVAIAFKNRWKVLFALVVPPLAAVALMLLTPKVYRAQSDILVKTGREYMPSSDGGENGAAAPTSTKPEVVNSEVALLISRAVAEKTITDIGLATLYPDIVDNPPTNGSSMMDAAVEQFGKDLGVDLVKLSNVISVSFDAPSANLAREVVNRVISVYIEKHIQVFAGGRAEGFQDSVDKLLGDIGTLERQRSKIKLDSGIYDISAQRAALITQRVDAQGHLQDVITRQATLQSRLAFLKEMRPRIANTMQSTSTDKSDEAVHAHQSLIDLRQSEAAMAARYGDGNPDLQRVRSQIAALQHTMSGLGTMRTNTSTVPSPLAQQVDQELVMGNAELAPLAAEIARYQTLIGTIDAELRRIEEADLALRTTVSRIDLLTDNLKAVEGHYEQARTQEQTELARQVSVVQVAKAFASEKAVKPKKLIYAAGGTLAGILLAGAVVVLSILTNKTLISVESAERLLGLPVLASLPLQRRRVRGKMLELE